MQYEIADIRLSFGELPVLDGISASFPASSITTILGPSGCGKTTLLNVIAGLRAQDSGERSGFGSGVLGYVFQEPRLLPWASVRENAEFVRPPHEDKASYAERCEHFLARLGLTGFFDERPQRLSGGMRQRVALARAFAYSSDVLLMDEPFQSVDIKTRIGLWDLLLDLVGEDPRTVIIVTHDVREALYLSDRILVLSERPSRLIGSFEVRLPRSGRSYASPDAAELEARLYALLLG